MIYQLLKPLIRLSLFIFYRRVDVIGMENVVRSGPAIFVANHPNALIDPLVVAAILPRKIFFIAGANFFGKGFRTYLFKRHFNMIPVYRPWLSDGKKVSNEEMFNDCFRALSDGKSILLFPEASSETVSKIRDVKTGAIRIKCGAEAFMQNNTEVPIVPIGINYSNAHEFQSRVIINIEEPIQFNPKTFEDQEELKKMADQMKVALEKAIVHIENDDDEDLVKCVNRLYVDKLHAEEGSSYKDVRANFRYMNQISDAVTYFEKIDPKTTAYLSQKIRHYFAALKREGVSDDIISESDKVKPGVLRVLLSILGLPFALLSLVINFVPYQLTAWLYRSRLSKLISDQDEEAAFNSAFTSSLIYGSGLGIFLLWNVVVSVVSGILFHDLLVGVVCFLVLFPLLRFSLFYLKISLYNMRYFKNQLFYSKNMERIQQLQKDRSQLINELKVLHEEYRNREVN